MLMQDPLYVQRRTILLDSEPPCDLFAEKLAANNLPPNPYSDWKKIVRVVSITK